MLKRGLRGCLRAAGLALILTGGAAGAATITLAPNPAPLTIGDTFSLDIVVSGLGAPPGGVPSLTSFEIDVAYDAAILEFVSLTFGGFLGTGLTNTLGDPCTVANLDGDCDVILESSFSPGLVELGNASLISGTTLDDNQPASGILASLEFEAIGFGTSGLAFSQAALSGTTGGSPSEDSLAVTTVGTSADVPEPLPAPGSLGLLAAGLAAAAWRCRAPTRRRTSS